MGIGRITTPGHVVCVSKDLRIGDEVAVEPYPVSMRGRRNWNGGGPHRFQIEILWPDGRVSGPGVRSQVFYNGYDPADLTFAQRPAPVTQGVQQ